ncbi:MAG: type III-B CRISPR module-associated protein Cmr5 [Myxococcales bacterium]|nr:type III-B CRISPR module-associated protein Cmr5 [Polyangiaceae bacterium]MDW8250181.1 type III-B CRISPR module-associated protein Cmr5 [Myxococcales bacterium]
MPSRDQERAALAFDHVSQFTGENNKAKAKKYGTMIHKLPALLQTAGLCQTMHFIQSRGDEDQKKILEHLAVQLRRVNHAIQNADSLLARVRQAELPEYLQLTDEAMACAAWYRRMVQGVLKVEAGEED